MNGCGAGRRWNAAVLSAWLIRINVSHCRSLAILIAEGLPFVYVFSAVHTDSGWNPLSRFRILEVQFFVFEHSCELAPGRVDDVAIFRYAPEVLFSSPRAIDKSGGSS